jgi:hypothetical protein
MLHSMLELLLQILIGRSGMLDNHIAHHHPRPPMYKCS